LLQRRAAAGGDRRASKISKRTSKGINGASAGVDLGPSRVIFFVIRSCIRRLIGWLYWQQGGGSWAEELVPCGAWSREVFGHLRLAARKSPRFLRDGPY
jgi:hypothetical protein